ncbi:sensor histidine kinase [Rhodococcus oryzae]|uniref:sensor histidine kinase n=1 Tax=Rhodococcus oryzae TaxID=2571143 RepID=UPI00371B7005
MSTLPPPPPPLTARIRAWHWIALDAVFAACVVARVLVELADRYRDYDPQHRGLPNPSGAALALAIVVVIVLGCVIGLRRVYPIGMCAVLLATWIVFVIVDGSYWLATPVGTTVLVATAMTVYQVAATTRPRTGLAALTVAVAAAPLALLGSPDLQEYLLPAITVTITGWALGYAVGRHRAYATELAEHHAQLLHADFVAQRMEIARELHDVIAHSMSVVNVQASYGQLVLDREPTKAAEALVTIENTSRDSIHELRGLLSVLREHDHLTPDDLLPAPRLADLDKLVARTAEAGVDVELHDTGHTRDLPAGIEVCAYRILQEALTNVVKHAKATSVVVTIDFQDTQLVIDICDDGHGESGMTTGHGITGMRERAALFGGSVSAGARSEGGYQVTAVLPLAGVDC